MRRKQIVVLGLVLVIISVGILQYNYNSSGESAKLYEDDLALEQGIDLEELPGAAVYVENNDAAAKDDAIAQVQQTGGFFAEARMERDKARSKQKDELKVLAQAADGSVTTSTSINSLEAQEQLLAIIRRADAESTIETLVKQKGFEDALAYMSDTDNVDVIVKATSLTSQDVAQISDIVIRHADVAMDKITVKNVD
ncbi:MAG: SpoIIIAH-like family protein [Acetivibrionales bacterium]|nr:SpoIIIAH-like family protein [Clostridiaceae bacterium]